MIVPVGSSSQETYERNEHPSFTRTVVSCRSKQTAASYSYFLFFRMRDDKQGKFNIAQPGDDNNDCPDSRDS